MTTKATSARRRGNRCPWALALTAAIALGGCSFTRQVTAGEALTANLSFLEVGRTDWREVLARLGPPPEIRTVPSSGRPMLRSFQYARSETACAAVNLQCYFCPIPVSPMLPFEWCDEQRTRGLLIEFDARGVVSAVSKSRTEVLWPPFEDTGDRVRRRETTLDAASDVAPDAAP
ncbi:MAG: hypothetical protein KC466_04985 [Myxococcales bacterium]|nr:hypothetical protein [Myxococcales bacterium]